MIGLCTMLGRWIGAGSGMSFGLAAGWVTASCIPTAAAAWPAANGKPAPAAAMGTAAEGMGICLPAEDPAPGAAALT